MLTVEGRKGSLGLGESMLPLSELSPTGKEEPMSANPGGAREHGGEPDGKRGPFAPFPQRGTLLAPSQVGGQRQVAV